MSKKYTLLTLIAVLLFTGCSSQKANGLQKNKFNSNALEYTSKCDILENDEVKAMFTATYLNGVRKTEATKNEKFVVGIFIADNQKKGILKKLDSRFKLSLNDSNFLSLKPIENNNIEVKNNPLYNPWADYYEVKFRSVTPTKVAVKANTNTDEKAITNELPIFYDLKLKLENLEIGSCQLEFAKKE